MKQISSSNKKHLFSSLCTALLVGTAVIGGTLFSTPPKVEAADCTITSATMNPATVPGDWHTSIPKSIVKFDVVSTGCINKEIDILIRASDIYPSTIFDKEAFESTTYIVQQDSFSLSFRLKQSRCTTREGIQPDCQYQFVIAPGGPITIVPWTHECIPTGCGQTSTSRFDPPTVVGLFKKVDGDCFLNYSPIIQPAVPGAGWYKENDPQKHISWLTSVSAGCVGEEVDFYVKDVTGTKVYDFPSLRPSSTSVNINLKPAELRCATSQQPDCKYRFFVNPRDGAFDDDEKQTPVNNNEWWGYDCDGPCEAPDPNKKFTLWEPPATVNPDGTVAETPAGGGIQGAVVPSLGDSGETAIGKIVADPNSPCWDPVAQNYKGDCYELLSDLPLLGELDKSVRSVTFKGSNSFGDTINMLFRLSIGVAGVLGVVMLIYAAWQYMTSDSGSGKATLKKRMLDIFLGIILLLGTVVLLQTINPDLLDLQPGIKSLNFTLNIEPQERTEASSIPGIDPANVPAGTTDMAPYGINQINSSVQSIVCPKSGGTAQVAAIAKSFQGKVKYTLGGNGYYAGCPAGQVCIDCSGFVNYVYYCAGIASPGQATISIFGGTGAQKVVTIAKQGNNIMVNGSPLVPGDLLGRTNYPSDPGGSGHVIVYGGGEDFYEVTSENNGKQNGKGFQVRKYNAVINWKNYIENKGGTFKINRVTN